MINLLSRLNVVTKTQIMSNVDGNNKTTVIRVEEFYVWGPLRKNTLVQKTLILHGSFIRISSENGSERYLGSRRLNFVEECSKYKVLTLF